MDKVIFKKDKSTIYHWFGYWLGAFIIAYIFQYKGYFTSFLIGCLISQLLWFLKELIWDVIYRKQPFNIADVLGGWLFLYVFTHLIKTQIKK